MKTQNKTHLLQIVDNNVQGGEDSDLRHYFSLRGATTEGNLNYLQLTLNALSQLAEGYRKGLPVLPQHDLGLFHSSRELPLGRTTDAVVMTGSLYISAYIMLDKTYRNGPYGNSNELRDAILDGAVNSVSLTYMVKKSTCSFCGESYGQGGACPHYGGQLVSRQEEGKTNIPERVYEVIEEAEDVELSLVTWGADENGKIVEKMISQSAKGDIDHDKYNLIQSQKKKETVMDEKEVQALKDAHKTIVGAKDVEIQSLKTQVAAFNENSQAKEINDLKKQVADLEKAATDNKALIDLGKQSRADLEQAYVNAYVTVVGTEVTQEAKDQAASSAKVFDIDTLQTMTKQLQSQAKVLNPEGKLETPEEHKTSLPPVMGV